MSKTWRITFHGTQSLTGLITHLVTHSLTNSLTNPCFGDLIYLCYCSWGRCLLKSCKCCCWCWKWCWGKVDNSFVTADSLTAGLLWLFRQLFWQKHFALGSVVPLAMLDLDIVASDQCLKCPLCTLLPSFADWIIHFAKYDVSFLQGVVLNNFSV